MSATKQYAEKLRQFDGIITPDPTIVIGKSKCLHEVSTYFNRAVGYFLQTQGIPVIPNIRWGDPSTYDFCFLGVPKNSIVAISTVGAIKKEMANDNLLRKYFRQGLAKMIEVIYPRDVIVYGRMPDDIFGEFMNKTRFHQYISEFESTHKKRD